MFDVHVAPATINLPGVPPPTFEEWEGDTEYPCGNGAARLANDLPSSSSENKTLSLYGGADFALFGPQYGIPARTDRIRSTVQTQFTVSRAENSDPYEDMLRQADANIQTAYADSQNSCSGLDCSFEFDTLFNALPTSNPPASIGEDFRIVEDTKAGPHSASFSEPPSTSCIICTEDFSAIITPPGWISLACLHSPSVCCGCLAKCIKNDLENKIWSQIKCPECSTLLIYEDIKRLADPATFSRYEVLAFRSAVGADANFVWCQKCDFGQLHDTGASQPIVRCLNCGFRSCFRHSVPWHDRLTCEEYDEMLRDPDGFQSTVDRADDSFEMARRLQEQEDEMLARSLEQRDKCEEEIRQRQLLEEERRKARAAQRAEAKRKSLEQDKAKQREELRRRAREDKLSLEKVQATTKSCPGCRWPIEKNEGCAHMTCTQCRYQFCWNCMRDWSSHGSRCRR